MSVAEGMPGIKDAAVIVVPDGVTIFYRAQTDSMFCRTAVAAGRRGHRQNREQCERHDECQRKFLQSGSPFVVRYLVPLIEYVRPCLKWGRFTIKNFFIPL